MRGRYPIGVWIAGTMAALAGCSVQTDYGGTGFRCSDGVCPAGQFCVSGFCHDPSTPPDAGDSDAPAADAGPDAPPPDAAPPDAVPPDAALPDAQPCTGGDEAFVGPDGHCYTRWDSSLDRDTAMAACVALGGHLATLETGPINMAVMVALVNTDVTVDDPYWIGLDDLDSEMTWVWIDGSSFMFTDWLPGEPNDSSGQDCGVVMVDAADGPGWNDRGCDNSLGYLCER